MFGRKRQQQREQEAAREAERRALFEELAKRPDTICPFLGLEDSRTGYRDRVSDSHRCYAFGDPAELSAEQQQKVCLQRGYGNCPRYLRGVLVIPTEELEALRRPQPAPPPVAPPPPPATTQPVPAGGGGRGPLVTVALLLLLAVGVGSVAFIALNSNGGVGQATPTPTASLEPTPGESLSTSLVPSPSASASTQPTGPATATPVPTPVVLPSVGPSESGLPTPGPNDEPTGYIVVVRRGEYPVVRINEDDEIVGEAVATFARRSGAPVERIRIRNTIYWRTLAGDYFGLAYSRALSDTFTVYETFETSDGEPRFRELDPDEYRP